MSAPVILRPAAVADIQGIYDELGRVRPGLSEQFSTRLGEVLDHIERNPELYGIVWRDVRAVRLRRFQYVLYYVVHADRVEVLAVMHGARNQTEWKSRT